MILKDKVVIITGIGPGMGTKMAELAAAEGAKIAICARSEDRLNEVAESIRQKGGDVLAIPTDIADNEACLHLAAETQNKYGRIDGLINSAYKHIGFSQFENADLAQWRDAMEVTFFGTMQMTQAVLPAMKAAGGGAICNISTMATRKPMPGEGGYASAKAAVMGATRMLAKELGQYNIRVNATVMGWMWGAPVEGYVKYTAKSQGIDEAQVIKGITANIPLGVVPPDEECARTVLMMVSDYTSMVTGTCLDVNGGEHMSS